MNSRRIAILVVAVVAAVAIGGVVASQLFLRGDEVPELGLDTPAPSAAASITPAATPAASEPPAAASSPPVAAGDLAGTWNVTEGEAGYRVRETFLRQQADTDAVGRTSGVTGSLTVDGTPGAFVITAGSIVVDMTTLESDESRRDNQLRGRGIETDTFPTSTFEIRGPVALPAELGSADVAVALPATLTLHGVTKDVEIAAQARLEADGTVVVAGSLPILFADYDIEAPSIAGLIEVQDNGVMEFRVILARG